MKNFVNFLGSGTEKKHKCFFLLRHSPSSIKVLFYGNNVWLLVKQQIDIASHIFSLYMIFALGFDAIIQYAFLYVAE